MRRKPKAENKGPLRVAIRADLKDGLVWLEFDTAIAQLGLPANNARQLAALILRKADECQRPS